MLDCPDRDSLQAYYGEALREYAEAEDVDEAVKRVRHYEKLLADHCQKHGCEPDKTT